MKIIQSFAQFDEGSHYLMYDENNIDKIYLNFYVNLLSVLTLQKYYNQVTMYCNQKAYDSFIKYLPYHEIKIVENKNPFEFWSYYKVDIIKRQTAKFIHVDPDVFIFDDLFSDFIKTRKYDIMVQDTIQPHLNPIKSEMAEIERYLKDIDDVHYKYCDGKAHSNGVIGMTVKVKKEFIKMCETFKKGYVNGELKVHSIAMIAEELALYLVAMHDELKCHEVLPYDEIVANGIKDTANKRKYTHMWGDSKFNLKYIELVKLKIKKEFPKSYSIVEKYEREVINNVLV